MADSLAEQLASLSEEEYKEVMSQFSEEELRDLQYDPDFWLRPEQKIDDGDSDWYITAITAGRGYGKGICISKSIPTTKGWKKLGEVRDGDIVFDENGQPCTVTKAHDPYMPDKLYELEFSDGTIIVADGDHLWTTWTHKDRKSYNRRNEYGTVDDDTSGLPEDWPNWTKYRANGVSTGVGPKVRNTQEIVDTFRYGKRGDLNHSIPVTKPVQYPEQQLEVDPYVFGTWLGDGFAGSSGVCGHGDDIDETIDRFIERGYQPLPKRLSKEDVNCYRFSVPKLSGQLRKQGSLHDKSIPQEYMIGSEQQRRDLLAGLLDTDGHFDPKAQVIEFCAKRKNHAVAVLELAQSLGQKAKLYEGEATIGDVSYGTKYRVKWRPTEKFFYMDRKNAEFKEPGAQASRNKHKMIVDYREIEPRMVRCLTVDSSNNLFLVGENYTVTHNTLAASHWVRKKAEENPGCRIAIGGRTIGDVRRIMVSGESGILAIHPPESRPEYKQNTGTLYWPNGTTAELHSSEAPDAARGPQYHYCVGDEFAAWKTTEDSSGATLYTNLQMATRLGRNPQILLATTPKRTLVMRDIFDRAKNSDERIRIIKGKTTDNTSLSSSYLASMQRQYGNSDLARQELEGEMIEDMDGIVFSQEMLHQARNGLKLPTYGLKIIAVDPSVSANPNTSDECGIVAMASSIERDTTRRRAILLQDYSLRASPDVWAQVVVDAAKEQGTKFIVVEKNQGGDLLRMVIQTKDPSLKVFTVTATKGKLKRAEPIVVAMQQGRIVFDDTFPELEDQLLFYDPENSNYSPDRLDAFVWGATALLVDPPKGLRVPHASGYDPGKLLIPAKSRGVGNSRMTSSIKRQR